MRDRQVGDRAATCVSPGCLAASIQGSAPRKGAMEAPRNVPWIDFASVGGKSLIYGNLGIKISYHNSLNRDNNNS